MNGTLGSRYHVIHPNRYPKLATICDDAAYMIERYGWWDGKGTQPGPGGPVSVCTAIARVCQQTFGMSPFGMTYAREAIRILANTLSLDEVGFDHWNDEQESAEPVTDALRLAATRLRFMA